MIIITKFYHKIIILAENMYCIHNRDYDHPYFRGAGQDLLFCGAGQPFFGGAGRGAHPW